jgi:hypothetical protein
MLTLNPHSTHPSLGIETMSHAFLAKFNGTCRLLGIDIVAGMTKVRTVGLVVLATGERFTATVPMRTLDAMQFVSEPDADGGGLSKSRFARAGTDEATAAINAALDGGARVQIITAKTLQHSSGPLWSEWRLNQHTGKVECGTTVKSRAQFVAQVAASAKAYRVPCFC